MIARGSPATDEAEHPWKRMHGHQKLGTEKKDELQMSVSSST